MPAEIFNPNPVVFSTTKAQRRTELSPHSLWVDDDGQDEVESDNSVEPIDQDEIFGKITPLQDLIRPDNQPIRPFQISFALSMTQNIRILSRNCESCQHRKYTLD